MARLTQGGIQGKYRHWRDRLTEAYMVKALAAQLLRCLSSAITGLHCSWEAPTLSQKMRMRKTICTPDIWIAKWKYFLEIPWLTLFNVQCPSILVMHIQHQLSSTIHHHHHNHYGQQQLITIINYWSRLAQKSTNEKIKLFLFTTEGLCVNCGK